MDKIQSSRKADGKKALTMSTRSGKAPVIPRRHDENQDEAARNSPAAFEAGARVQPSAAWPAFLCVLTTDEGKGHSRQGAVSGETWLAEELTPC